MDKLTETIGVQIPARYIAYCGNDCSQCPHYQQGCPEGCLGATCVNYCNMCQVRLCNLKHQLTNCAYCAEYPCQTLEAQYDNMKKDGYGHWAATARSVLENVRNTTALTPTASSLPYLGQTPPGNTPVIFAQGIISRGDVHSRLVISPDGKEMFWTTFTFLQDERMAKTWQMFDQNGKWTEPHVPPFLSTGMTSGCVFSPDGKKLFFNYSEDIRQGWKTQYVEKTRSGWSEPKSDGFLLKPSVSFTQSGMAYYSARIPGKPWNNGIYSARYSDSGYIDVQALDATINSPYIDYTPYISPEDDYLMFSSSRPCMDEVMFLFISFKNNDGTWSTPQKMNEKMGFSDPARFPSISPDGKYIFFCGDDGNIYWVNRTIVDQFK